MGYYDEITGSIPPCVEIEITNDTTENVGDETANFCMTQYTTREADQQNDQETSNNNEVIATEEKCATNTNLLTKTETCNEDAKFLTVDQSDVSVIGMNRLDGLELNKNEKYESASLERSSANPISMCESGDNPSVTDDKSFNPPTLLETKQYNDETTIQTVHFTESYAYSKPPSKKNQLGNHNEHGGYINNEHGYNTSSHATGDHDYCGGNEDGCINYNQNCSNEYGNDESYSYDENEPYTYEQLISMLRGTHEDLNNQIYWHIKEQVSSWYRQNPGKKFDLSSLDEDLKSLAQPYVNGDEWEDNEAFYEEDENFDDYDEAGDEDLEELVDGE